MKKKLITIGILGILLITSFISASGTNIKNSTEKIEKHIRNWHPLDSEYSYEVIYEPSYDVAHIAPDDGAVDITYENFTAWWASNNNLCFHFWIINIGDACNANGRIEIILHKFYDDGDPDQETLRVLSYPVWQEGKIYGKFRTWDWYKRPKEVKLEIKSNLPEADFSNNVKTIPVYSGVILHGWIYNGTELVVENAYAKCNSDVPEFDPELAEFSMDLVKGQYVLHAPKHPKKPPLKYNITVQVDNKYKSKFTRRSLIGLRNARVDFIFGTKSKSINSLKNQHLFHFPVLARLLQQLPVFTKLTNF